MDIDVREWPELLETLSQELSAHNTVELKFERDRQTGQDRVVLIRIDRKVKAQERVIDRHS